MPKKAEFFSGTGRRKRAVARVWLYAKKGDIVINDKPVKEVFSDREDVLAWVKPFHAIGVSHPQAKYSASIKISGGGKSSRVEAIQMGIARALVAMDESLKPPLREAGLMTRDSRKKERKKPFLRKARKRPQYSKR